jgi:hypothetical protein
MRHRAIIAKQGGNMRKWLFLIFFTPCAAQAETHIYRSPADQPVHWPQSGSDQSEVSFCPEMQIGRRE